MHHTMKEHTNILCLAHKHTRFHVHTHVLPCRPGMDWPKPACTQYAYNIHCIRTAYTPTQRAHLPSFIGKIGTPPNRVWVGHYDQWPSDYGKPPTTSNTNTTTNEGSNASTTNSKQPASSKFQNGTCNDPSAGSPTETLLRLLLPLNDQVWSSSRHLYGNHLSATTTMAPIQGPY